MKNALLVCGLCAGLVQAADPIQIPNGLAITPTAIPHSISLPLNPGLTRRPNFQLGQAVTTALSPDGSQLLVLTSGYNKERQAAGNTDEFVLVYDVSSSVPRQVQALPLPNTFCGLAWNPNGQEFYVSAGVDDSVYIFARKGLGYARAGAVALGHVRGNGLMTNAPAPRNAEAPKPMTAGIAVNAAGTVAVAANFYNDSISLIDLSSRRKAGELDLRPGVIDTSKSGIAGGEYPYWVVIQGNDRAYVSSPRDREIVVVQMGASPTVIARVPVTGQPNRMILNRAQNRLFVALDNADSVGVIDTASNKVLAMFGVVAPAGMLPQTNAPKGANPNSLALSPDEQTLYVTNGGTNSVAVVKMAASGAGTVSGLLPTGWYPNSVSVSADGKTLYIVSGKSMPGPNKGNCRGDVKAPKLEDCPRVGGDYILTLEKSTLMAAPVPGDSELAALTKRVAQNNHFDAVLSAAADPVMVTLRERIQHIIYIVKENRSYDQVLGDLEVGDGDPSLTEFPEPLTPNHHALARKFVTLDNFLDSGDVSGDGWNWSTAARATDFTVKSVPVNYAGRGFSYDWEGMNRNINIGIGSVPERVKAQPLLNLGKLDPNILPGNADVAGPDSATGEAGTGYLWDEALRAGLTVRNYGLFCDLSRYDNAKANSGYLPVSKTPFASKLQQTVPTSKSLMDKTDLYFRCFDQENADFYLFKEWEREFDQYVTDRNLPNLSLVRFAHDHFGSFKTALYGVNTPALQFSDNDYAIGLLAQKVANSRYRDSTLIFVIEDDAQDGPDHVDAHRSSAFVIGPYVKQGAVVSERYTTVNMIRTMEALMGAAPSSLQSAAAAPMSEVFDLNQSAWTYTAIVPDILRSSELPLPAATAENSLPRTPRVLAYANDKRTTRYWQKKLGDMDYEEEDKLDTPRFNRELWRGMMGKLPYPTMRSGKDLRKNREALLAPYRNR